MASGLFTFKSAPRLLIPLLCFGVLVSLFLFLQHTSMVDLSFFGSYATVSQTNCEVSKVLAERGARLSHSWTDEELFERAVRSDQKEVPERIPASNESYMSHLHSYLFKSTSSGSPFVFPSIKGGDLTGRSCGRNLTLQQKARPKIAFLFLTTGALPFAPLWNQFFKGNEHLYNIYVHLDPFRVNLFDRSSGVFWGRLVPPDKTERGTAALVAAERRLLANALLDDPLNKYFAIISDHCIPLHGFRRVYKQVTKSDKSFLEILDDAPTLPSRYVARGKDVMLPEVPFSKFRVGSQFFVLTREHAVMIVSDKKYWKKFGLRCLDPSSCYAEEHYFPTLVEIEDPQGSTRYTLTYVNWASSAGGHPKSYKKSEVSRQLIESLQSEKKGRFLFARKFEDDCVDVLLQLAPLILKH